MNAQLSSPRHTVGQAIKGTVSAAADTATNVISTTNKTIGMVTRLIDDASTRQHIRSNMDMLIFKATVHQDKAIELADSRLKSKEYMAKSADHNTMFENAFNELQACL